MSRIAGMFSRRRADVRLDDEVRAHLEMLATEYERGGMTPEEARFAARRTVWRSAVDEGTAPRPAAAAVDDRVVLISDGIWRRRFGADPRIVGTTVQIDAQPYEIVGVLPPSFVFPRLGHLYAIPVGSTQPDLWKPMALRLSALATLFGVLVLAVAGIGIYGVTAFAVSRRDERPAIFPAASRA